MPPNSPHTQVYGTLWEFPPKSAPLPPLTCTGATPEPLFLEGRAPSPMLMGSSASGPGKVLLEMRSQGIHQEHSTAAFILLIQNSYAKKRCSSFHHVFEHKTTSSSPPQQTSIQHQQAKGHKAAAAAKEMSRHRTAAHPALLSNCSQLTLTKGPFSEAVTALGVVNSKAVRQPEPWSQPVHIFWGPISLLLTDHLFQTMQHQGPVSCPAPEVTSLL